MPALGLHDRRRAGLGVDEMRRLGFGLGLLVAVIVLVVVLMLGRAFGLDLWPDVGWWQ